MVTDKRTRRANLSILNLETGNVESFGIITCFIFSLLHRLLYSLTKKLRFGVSFFLTLRRVNPMVIFTNGKLIQMHIMVKKWLQFVKRYSHCKRKKNVTIAMVYLNGRNSQSSRGAEKSFGPMINMIDELHKWSPVMGGLWMGRLLSGLIFEVPG